MSERYVNYILATSEVDPLGVGHSERRFMLVDELKKQVEYIEKPIVIRQPRRKESVNFKEREDFT